jgi:hypothetical protein
MFWRASHLDLGDERRPRLSVGRVAEINVDLREQDARPLAALGNPETGTSLDQSSDELVEKQALVLVLAGRELTGGNMAVKSAHRSEKILLDRRERLDAVRL